MTSLVSPPALVITSRSDAQAFAASLRIEEFEVAKMSSAHAQTLGSKECNFEHCIFL